MHFDIAVVGAGPAGSTCAIAALQNGARRVALIDTESFPRDKCCGDGIGPGAVLLLKTIGAGHIVSGYQPIEHVALTSPAGHLARGPVPNVGGAVAEGYTIPRAVFDAGLFRHALATGATDLSGRRCEGASFADGHWTVQLHNAASGAVETITADVLIGADGARSKVRRILGSELNTDDHTAIAIRIYAESRSRRFDALQIDFAEDVYPGYSWLFPISETRVNVGVGIDLWSYKEGDTRLEQMLATYRARLGEDLVYDETSMKTFLLPLATQLPRLADTTRNAALIGDAGSMINPISGEGIFYGMFAGELLGRLLGQRQKQAAPIPDALAQYQAQFLRKFGAHYHVNGAMKKATETTLCDMVVKAGGRDEKVMADLLAVILGDKPQLNRGTFLRIIARNFVPFMA